MNPSESAQFSVERVARKTVTEDLNAERSEYKSTRDYVRGLGEFYERNPETRGTLPQLQRLARTITNPNNDPNISVELSQAFYWGEIVGYRAGQLQGQDDWTRRSYDVLNDTLIDEGNETQSKTEHPEELAKVNERALRISNTIMGALEMGDELYLPAHIDNLIEEWSCDISDNTMVQLYFMLGCLHLVTAITKDMETALRAQAVNNMMISAGIENEDPDTEPVTDVIEGLIDVYIKAMAAEKLKPSSTDEELGAVSDHVTYKLNRAFLKQDQLSLNEDVVIKGDALYAVFYQGTDELSYHVLAPTEKLEGEIEAIRTTEMLSVASIPLFKAYAQNEAVDISEVRVNPLSLVLILKNGVVMTDRDAPTDHKKRSETQYYMALAPDESVAIVLDNPGMVISRYI